MNFRTIALVLFISFFTFSAKAEWVKCTITYADDKTKTGFVEYFTDSMKKTVSFKEDLKAKKAEKIKSDELKKLIYTLNDGSEAIMLRLHGARYNMSKNIKKDNQRMWLGLIYSGGLNVLAMNYVSSIHAGIHHESTNIDFTYFNWPGEDYALEIFMKGHGTTFVVNARNTMRKTCEVWFRDKCSEMSNQLKSGTFKPGTVEEVVEFFEQNCGKNKK